MLEVGLVMLQGSRRAHEVAIRAACDLTNTSVSIRELRSLGDLISGGLDAVILPGGESTTMRIVGGEGGTGLLGPLYSIMRENREMPVLATCAGTILLADPQDGETRLSPPKWIGMRGGGRLTHSSAQWPLRT